jgi:hypothetical protein
MLLFCVIPYQTLAALNRHLMLIFVVTIALRSSNGAALVKSHAGGEGNVIFRIDCT